MGAHVQLIDVDLGYKNSKTGEVFLAAKGLSIDVAEGEFVAIVGTSGCGKSTLLLALDGLIDPMAGAILVRGEQVSAPGRDRAMVFQEAALYPWRTVTKNIAFGLEVQGLESSPEKLQRYVDLVAIPFS